MMAEVLPWMPWEASKVVWFGLVLLIFHFISLLAITEPVFFLFN